MSEQVSVYESKMKKTLASLESELMTIRAGRANPNILNKLTVDYYGTPTPIQQVGNISVPEARMIVIQPWEKSMIKEIEKSDQHVRYRASTLPMMDRLYVWYSRNLLRIEEKNW